MILLLTYSQFSLSSIPDEDCWKCRHTDLPGGICPFCFFQMTVTSGSGFDWHRNSTSVASCTVTSLGPSMILGLSVQIDNNNDHSTALSVHIDNNNDRSTALSVQIDNNNDHSTALYPRQPGWASIKSINPQFISWPTSVSYLSTQCLEWHASRY